MTNSLNSALLIYTIIGYFIALAVTHTHTNSTFISIDICNDIGIYVAKMIRLFSLSKVRFIMMFET